jgi:hypothetical protein
MEHERKAGIRKGNNSSKRKSAFSRAKQKMKEEMDQAWKDFFEKNPDIKEEDLRRRVEERLRRKRD